MIQSIFLILLATICYAYPTTLKISQGEKYVDVRVREYEGLHLSEICFSKKNPKCDAYTATLTKSSPSITKTGLLGHPASRYCNDKNGLARILIAEDKKQYDFCLFKDGSMIDSWDLYYKHFPKRIVD